MEKGTKREIRRNFMKLIIGIQEKFLSLFVFKWDLNFGDLDFALFGNDVFPEDLQDHKTSYDLHRFLQELAKIGPGIIGRLDAIKKELGRLLTHEVRDDEIDSHDVVVA